MSYAISSAGTLLVYYDDDHTTDTPGTAIPLPSIVCFTSPAKLVSPRPHGCPGPGTSSPYLIAWSVSEAYALTLNKSNNTVDKATPLFQTSSTFKSVKVPPYPISPPPVTPDGSPHTPCLALISPSPDSSSANEIWAHDSTGSRHVCTVPPSVDISFPPLNAKSPGPLDSLTCYVLAEDGTVGAVSPVVFDRVGCDAEGVRGDWRALSRRTTTRSTPGTEEEEVEDVHVGALDRQRKAGRRLLEDLYGDFDGMPEGVTVASSRSGFGGGPSATEWPPRFQPGLTRPVPGAVSLLVLQGPTPLLPTLAIATATGSVTVAVLGEL